MKQGEDGDDAEEGWSGGGKLVEIERGGERDVNAERGMWASFCKHLLFKELGGMREEGVRVSLGRKSLPEERERGGRGTEYCTMDER